jgi:hypothetical protein
MILVRRAVLPPADLLQTMWLPGISLGGYAEAVMIPSEDLACNWN